MSRKDRSEAEKQGSPQDVPRTPSRTRWSDYVWANLLFWAFLAALLLTARASCSAPGDGQSSAVPYVLDGTFVFLAALLGGTFVLVTLFDAAYEFFAVTAEKPLPPEEAPRI